MAIHFPSFPLYMAVISLKRGVFAVALLDKAMPHSLSPHANVMMPVNSPVNGAVVANDCLCCLKRTFIV